MTISPWWLLALAVPVLMLGELLVRRVRFLARFDLPVPVVGGFLIALAVLAFNLLRPESPIVFDTKTRSSAWTWLVTAETEWRRGHAAVPVFLPFSTAFFTCVGLNASWSVAKRGSWQLLILLGLATGLGVFQNILGVTLARAMGQSPLLGLMCGSVTLTGGPSTALGFAPTFQLSGLTAAPTVGAAAAMFGIVTGSLLGGTVGGTLVRRRSLRGLGGRRDPRSETVSESVATPQARTRRTFFAAAADLAREPFTLIIHLGLLLACIKAGAWVSLWLNAAGLTFPVYMGAMLVGIVLRNTLDAAGIRILRTDVIDRLGAVALGIFLAAAMCSLNLLELRSLAAPMLMILSAQVVLTILFAYFVTFLLTGRDYDAAVTSAGHVGFGLGITANAVATMDAVTEKFGPAPRAFLIVTIVGAFLIDLTNALTITLFLNLLK
jgi:ESS family glutamate:Na+ symporter